MNSDDVHGHDDKSSKSLISPEFLKIITVWSVIPAYLIAGAALGWLADKWLGTAPYLLGLGLLIALVLAVRDVARIRREW
jgi:F0F1-type ATP synthase assembly protein I